MSTELHPDSVTQTAVAALQHAYMAAWLNICLSVCLDIEVYISYNPKLWNGIQVQSVAFEKIFEKCPLK